MSTEVKPPRNRKGKQVYAGIGALAVGFAFVVWMGAQSGKAEIIAAYTALYVTFATAICSLCGVGIWGNVKEHQSQQPTPPARDRSSGTDQTSTPLASVGT